MTYPAVVLLAVSVYKSRSVHSADDFMVAGRRVPVYLLVATLVCTWIGSGSLFGTAGLTFRTGVSGPSPRTSPLPIDNSRTRRLQGA